MRAAGLVLVAVFVAMLLWGLATSTQPVDEQLTRTSPDILADR